MSGINLVWEICAGFTDEEVIQILEKYDGKKENITSKYERWIWKAVGLTVKCFKEKLVVQGTENEKSLNLLRDLSAVETLRFNPKNAKKFAKLFPIEQNAILCTECNRPSLLIEGEIEGLDIVFKKECGHKTDLKPPLFMYTCRILPDVNILISNNLSRYVELGFFDKFEVILPNFVMQIINLLGAKEKQGASREITKLRKLERKHNIVIFNCNDGFDAPSTKTEFQKVEDDVILKIANLTNSILLTGDGNLKDKALLNKRPTIYIHPKESKQVKIIERVRKGIDNQQG